MVDKQLVVTLQHLADVRSNYLTGRSTFTYNTWAFPDERPAGDVGPAERTVECPACKATVSYQVLTAAATARRRRAFRAMVLCGVALLAAAVVLLVTDPFDSGSILVGLLFAVGAGVAAGGVVGRLNEGGVRGGQARTADGSRARRHGIAATDVVVDPDVDDVGDARQGG